MEQGTIVVADDESNIADLVDLYLAREGYRVVQAATGQDTLDAVERSRPRLVVLDVGLPDIDGLEVCRRLRRTSSIPVIFLTARDGEIDRILGLELGADDYMTKPFSPPSSSRAVKAVLRRVDGGAAAEVVQAGRRRDRPRPPRGARRRRGRRVHDEGVRAPALPRGATRPRAVAPADPRRRVGLRLVRRRAHRRRAHRAGAQEGRRRGADHDRARPRLPARSERHRRDPPARRRCAPASSAASCWSRSSCSRSPVASPTSSCRAPPNARR